MTDRSVALSLRDRNAGEEQTFECRKTLVSHATFGNPVAEREGYSPSDSTNRIAKIVPMNSTICKNSRVAR